MNTMNRRKFIELAASFGATLAWGSIFASESRIAWRERRDVYPQGVGSGDPHPDSVILWTRRPPGKFGEVSELLLEVAEDFDFHKVMATATASISAETDWTCRVLAAGLKPRQVYWYRFTDQSGFGSRIGRTVTAPSEQDEKQIAFAFVSCQNIPEGACNAYRRMIWEDEKHDPQDQLGFVLHLGDYVYEVLWYPEDRPQGNYDRRIRDIVRYQNGQKFKDMHYPTTLEDYRILYRSYLTDPDLQDARARWPFVCVWDNHEFSWKGRQSIQNVDVPRPGQKTKVAANQAWFEYQPGRVLQPGGFKLDRFRAPDVENAPIEKFDEHGLGQERGNLAAIRSLRIFRTLRYGRNVNLILTDNHSFRSDSATDLEESERFQPKNVRLFFPQEALEKLDAAPTYNEKNRATVRFNEEEIPNPRKGQPPKTILGVDQKKWFLNEIKISDARWKLWGNSFGSLDARLDLQKAPDELKKLWPAKGYGVIPMEWCAYPAERAEIFDFVQAEKITGFVSIAGDRHSFFAGLLSASLPPNAFVPVGAEFITGSVSAPTLVESLEYNLPKDDPLRAIFLADDSGSRPKPVINLSLLHGIRSALNFSKTKNLQEALSERNPDLAPHLWFADMGGHGYAVVYAQSSELKVEFVCIPRPIERSERADGGQLQYRVEHQLKLWKPGESPRLEQKIVEGNIPPGASRIKDPAG